MYVMSVFLLSCSILVDNCSQVCLAVYSKHNKRLKVIVIIFIINCYGLSRCLTSGFIFMFRFAPNNVCVWVCVCGEIIFFCWEFCLS